MRLKRVFLVTFAFFLVIWGFSAFSMSKSEQIQQIDGEIKELEGMKRGYEARALRHENQAEYLQFDQQAVLETRRHLQLAQENRNKAELVQKEINRLNDKKLKLQS